MDERTAQTLVKKTLVEIKWPLSDVTRNQNNNANVSLKEYGVVWNVMVTENVYVKRGKRVQKDHVSRRNWI